MIDTALAHLSDYDGMQVILVLVLIALVLSVVLTQLDNRRRRM